MSEHKKIIFEKKNDEESPELENWENFNLKPALLKGLYSIGFERPSFIQKKAIPVIVSGRNIRAQAQSGTGKTGAFVTGSLQVLDETLDQIQVLVLVSTREIAYQIYKTYEIIGKNMGVKTCLLVGGMSVEEDKNNLNKNNHIVVGTPGRVLSLLQRNILNPNHIKMFILDEADELCNVNFIEQLKDIYTFLSLENLQSLFFSATYSPYQLEVISYITKDSYEIDLRNDEYTLQGIKQFFINISEKNVSRFGEDRNKELLYKIFVLIEILKNETANQIMVFTKRKLDAKKIYDTLKSEKFACTHISSDLDQAERTEVINSFKSGSNRILVTSDLCKRGIDVQGLSIVICLDVPKYESKEDFIHRVGRSGRYGRRGVAIHILNSNELEVLRKIAEDFQTTLEEFPSNFSLKE